MTKRWDPEEGRASVRVYRERVLLVGVQLPDDEDASIERSFGEMRRLIETLGGEVLQAIIQKRSKPAAATYVGPGKAAEVGRLVRELDGTLVAFDCELTGGQQRSLEKIMDCRVVDRTGIILDIFSRHARTKEAKNQVELASLEYLATHLTGRWTHLERQKGGIGMRGVGEKQIELDRRQIRTRISRLKRDIEHMAHDKTVQRVHRDRFLRVALVGYTNAGKSTLMNALTQSNVLVDDKLFATLDSTVRVIDPRTRPAILLSDTVGFIDKLPHNLVASFRSTLQEVLEADLLLHVVDLASPTCMEELDTTNHVLDEIGAGDKPSMLVFNKSDLVKEFFLPKLLKRKYINSTVVSALSEDDAIRLRDEISVYFEQDMIEMELLVPYDNTILQSKIHEHSRIVEKHYLDEGAQFKIKVMQSTANWLQLAQYQTGVSP